MELIAALSDLCKNSPAPVIAIDGPAGAGKTTLAQNLYLALSLDRSVRVIHMDDLYDGWDNALGPQLTETLEYIVQSHRAHKNFTLSFYDWNSGQSHPAQQFAPVDLLILEGVGSGQLAIRDCLSALIWIDIDAHDGMARVIERDGQRVASPMQNWLASQEQHFLKEGTQNAADFILTT
jgi:uridine kinase